MSLDWRDRERPDDRRREPWLIALVALLAAPAAIAIARAVLSAVRAVL